MQELVAALLLWMGSNTSLGYQGEIMPDVVLVSPAALAVVMFEGDVPEGVDVDRMRVAGLYNFKDQTVYLRDDIDLATVPGRALLVHELAHFVQFEQGIPERLRCKQALEPVAYRVQARYLQYHGERVPFSQAHVERVSTCS